MVRNIFKGLGIALVTPFNEDGTVDYDSLKRLVEYQLKNGADFFCILATTGETPCLSTEEKLKIKNLVVDLVNGRVPILMGCGGYNTAAVVNELKTGDFKGIDGILSICPYYNKPSQEGLYQHFKAIAAATKLPIVLYNVPGRTGVNMSVDTVKYLAEKYSNIVALKQSYGDMDTITELKINCPEDFILLSGDDSLTMPMMALGVHGVISVASHIFGKEIKNMIMEFKSGNIENARKIHNALYPSFRKLFMAPNPIPVKAALANLNIIEEYVRKPLVLLTDDEKAILNSTISTTKDNLTVLLK